MVQLTLDLCHYTMNMQSYQLCRYNFASFSLQSTFSLHPRSHSTEKYLFEIQKLKFIITCGYIFYKLRKTPIYIVRWLILWFPNEPKLRFDYTKLEESKLKKTFPGLWLVNFHPNWALIGQLRHMVSLFHLTMVLRGFASLHKKLWNINTNNYLTLK